MNLRDILQLPFSLRQKKARAHRLNVEKSDFVDGLGGTALERSAAVLLWDMLVEAATIPDFKPLPDDDLEEIYGLAEEDLDEDVILRLVSNLHLKVPGPQTLAATGAIRTPRDIIRLISATATD